ncbi:hypothetical protein CBS101457_003758 [Exobasidium rhododendri]|nr:hypothetical protein CBS101457_003758 [Exobasidium rhododendri]
MANFGHPVRQDHYADERVEGGEDSDSSSGTASQHTRNGDLSIRPPPKKRNRAALSCTLCRERKVKCDRVIPCQQCIKRGDEEYCRLDPNKRGPQSSVKVIQGQGKKQHSHSHSSGEYGHAPSGSPPVSSSASEVDAIKARLAQLEQVLAQKNSTSESSSGISSLSPSRFSPPGFPSRAPYGGGGNGNGKSALPVFASNQANQQSDHFPSPHFLSSHRSSTSSNSHLSSPKLPNAFFNTALGDNLGGRLPPISNSPSPNSGRLHSFSSSDRMRNRASSTDLAFNMPSLPSILREGSATYPNLNSSSAPSKSPHRGDVDSDTEDAALVLEGLAMGTVRSECDGKKLTSTNSVRDIIEKAPLKSIHDYAEQDKTKDIMSVDDSEAVDEAKCTQAESKEMQSCTAMGDSSSLARSSEVETPKMAKECQALAELLKKNPDAEFGPDGKRIPPAKRVCILLSRHEDSLFNLVYGPETFLGWGIGWAFPAAEAAGDMMSVSDVVGCKGALQREAVLRAIIRSLPDRESAEHLVDCFESRVKLLTGNCLHLPSFKKEMRGFYDLPTIEKRARAINSVDPGWLSLFLMILVLALHFHPCERPDSIMHFFDGRTLHLWRSAAQTCLVLARYQSSQSISVLQTIIFINLHSMGSGKDTFGLMNVAISNAVEMGLHRLGNKGMQPKPGENSGISIRREIAKRIWHHFVKSDWCSAGMHGGVYRIHPSQFNTPLPGNYNDSDLCIYPLPPPRPTSEHTEMSFSLSQLQVAIVNRENVDMQNASEQDANRLNCSDSAYLDGRYRGLLEQAPSFYKLGSEEGANENIEVERWLFLQSVFHKLLRLHRPQLSSRASARTTCVMLARSILDLQSKIRCRCSVVDRLYTNLGQSFSAAIVLCLDLLQTPTSASTRKIIRGEVFEALKALRHIGANHLTTESNIRVIEALLEEEEVRWKQTSDQSDMFKRKRDGNSGQLKKNNILNLARRVAKAAYCQEPLKVDQTANVGEEGDGESHGETMMDDVQLASATKDEQSRQLFEQLMGGKAQYDEPSSFSSASFQNNNNGFGQGNNAIAANGFDLSQSFAPFQEENGQSFDFEKFLAECDNNSSPGSMSSGGGGGGASSGSSGGGRGGGAGVGGKNPYDQMMGSGASDSGHSSLHGGGRANKDRDHNSSNDSSSGRMSHSSSRSQLHTDQDSPNQVNLVPSIAGQGISPAVDQPTGLDGFWNWILNQGNMTGVPAAESFKLPLGGGSLPAPQSQAAQQSLQQQQFNSPSVNFQFQELLSRGMDVGKDSQVDNAAAAAFPSSSYGLQQPNQMISSNAGFSSNSGTNANDGAISLGTPSAGMGHSWMSTPGLFEFAYEFSNDGNPNNGNIPSNPNNTFSQ